MEKETNKNSLKEIEALFPIYFIVASIFLAFVITTFNGELILPKSRIMEFVDDDKTAA